MMSMSHNFEIALEVRAVLMFGLMIVGTVQWKPKNAGVAKFLDSHTILFMRRSIFTPICLWGKLVSCSSIAWSVKSFHKLLFH